jgi:hypothetical protein
VLGDEPVGHTYFVRYWLRDYSSSLNLCASQPSCEPIRRSRSEFSQPG